MTAEPTQYEIAKSPRFSSWVYVLCYLDRFQQDVPDDIRRLGPWRGWRGAVADLRPEVRQALELHRYVLHADIEPVWDYAVRK